MGFWTCRTSLDRGGPCRRVMDVRAKMRVFTRFGGLPKVLDPLEAQQRYSSYRAILAAIVSQKSFVVGFMGYRTVLARYVAKWVIAQMCLCETKYQGGVSHHFGGVLASLKKYHVIWGIAAIPDNQM